MKQDDDNDINKTYYVDKYANEYNSISDLLTFIQPADNDNDINKTYYVDKYMTKQQKRRDRKITKLLSAYVEAYIRKSESNKEYKALLLYIYISILGIFCISFIAFIYRMCFNVSPDSVPGAIQLMSVCVTFLGLIVGLLQVITKYVFPEKEEEYITRIVELIQNNDLENKRENMEAQRRAGFSEKVEK